MSNGALDARGAALEEAFFQRENERLRERLRAERERAETREALARDTGLQDDSLLERLVELGIHLETLEALVLVPLVEVAWADGQMDERERDAVLRAAEARGMTSGTPGHALLESWTQERPAPALMESWRAYIAALCKDLSADHRWHLEEQILGNARAVARAAGGFLGLAKVSKAEEAVLAQLEAAFRER